jgi:chemotaxis protein MotB
MSGRGNRGRVSHERWLVSYADFITLMFAFFVVLYASAKTDQKKQIQISSAIDEAFRSLGIFPSATRNPSTRAGADATADHPVVPMNIVMGEDVLSPTAVKDDLERIQRELTQALSNQVATHTVSIQMGRDGLVISLREAGFFASGSAMPRPEAQPTLRAIAVRLGQTPYDVRIEGHTDNVPIHTNQFDSNWELSAARATGIARLFLDQKLIKPERVSAAGYAEFHPVATNETADGRAENRRVDLVILPRSRIDFASAAQAAAPTQNNGTWRKVTDE